MLCFPAFSIQARARYEPDNIIFLKNVFLANGKTCLPLSGMQHQVRILRANPHERQNCRPFLSQCQCFPRSLFSFSSCLLLVRVSIFGLSSLRTSSVNIFISYWYLLVNIGQVEGLSRIKTRQNRLPKKAKKVITETQQVARHTNLHDYPSLQMTLRNNIRI